MRIRDTNLAEILNEIGNPSPVISFRHYVSSKMEQSLDLAVQAAERGSSDKSIWLSILASYLSDAGLYDEALQSIESIPNEHRRPYSELVLEQARAGLFDEAKKTADRMPDEDSRNLAYVNIAALRIQAGKSDDSRRELASALKIAKGLGYTGNQAQAYLSIASAQAHLGMFWRAGRTLGKIRRNECGNNELVWEGYLRIADKHAQAGHFDKVEQTIKSISDYVWKSKAYSKIAVVQAEKGDPDSAKEKFALALELVKKRVEYYKRGGVYDDIASDMLRVGMIDEVIQLAEEARVNDRDPIYSKIAAAQAEKGMIDEALETAKHTHDSHQYTYRSETLSKIAVIQAERGDFKGALNTAGLIAQFYYQNSDRARAYLKIGIAQAKAGSYEGARTSLDNSVEAAGCARAEVHLRLETYICCRELMQHLNAA